jgi:hypothetical protein
VRMLAGAAVPMHPTSRPPAQHQWRLICSGHSIAWWPLVLQHQLLVLRHHAVAVSVLQAAAPEHVSTTQTSSSTCLFKRTSRCFRGCTDRPVTAVPGLSVHPWKKTFIYLHTAQELSPTL